MPNTHKVSASIFWPLQSGAKSFLNKFLHNLNYLAFRPQETGWEFVTRLGRFVEDFNDLGGKKSGNVATLH